MKNVWPLLFLIAACATTPVPQAPVEAAPVPPPRVSSSAVPGAEQFAALEAQLLEADPFILRFHIESKGAITALAKGDVIRIHDSFSLHAYGKAGGEDKEGDLKLEHAPEATRRTVILGMTRMGLLHNIYRLYSKQDVDADIDRRVEAGNVMWDPVARKFTFDIMVQGAKTAEVELWVNEANRPVQRHVVVHFPQGDMNVRESYVWPHS
ncbi:MAG TPA: hypothetical protein VN181_12265 [Thermoanaerobaculia bacterium]|nr:hypothetical protein [Thermoanaerobaculia bacterium]